MNLFDHIRMLAERANEIKEATSQYPDIEIGEAYRKYKESRGEPYKMLRSSDLTTQYVELKKVLDKIRSRPCNQPGCSGTQHLESVCSSCVEGRAGYRSKWTCDTCLHRELSKEDINSWILKLSSG